MRFRLVAVLLLLSAPVWAAQRIIALAPHLVENLYSIGAGDQLVGVLEHSNFPEAAKQLPVIGNHLQLNIEAILALKPDLILAWRQGNPQTELQRLQAMGIRIEYSEPQKLQDIAREFIWLGGVTGQQEQADEVARLFRLQLEEVRQGYASRKPVRVFYELWPQPLSTIASGAWPQQFLDICRLDNPFIANSRPYPNINIEQVIKAAPEIIIQPYDDAGQGQSTANWQRWMMIPAVEKQQFIPVDGDKLHRMTQRALPELTRLCEMADKYR